MQQLTTTLPRVIANLNLNYFLKSFRDQGWEGNAWAEVNRRKPDTKEYLYPSKPKASSRTNPINIRTGAMRRAVSSSLKEATMTRIRFVIDMRAVKGTKENYAQFINEGTDKMAKRKFFGSSSKITQLNVNKIKSYTDKIWKTQG